VPEEGVEVRVLGLDELATGLHDLSGEIGRETPRGLATAAGRMATTVRAKVPHDTGALAGSVVSGVEGDHAFLGMGEGLPYAGWIEYGGTRGRDYYPEGRFVYPTAVADQGSIEDAAIEQTKKTIGGHSWKSPT